MWVFPQTGAACTFKEIASSSNKTSRHMFQSNLTCMDDVSTQTHFGGDTAHILEEVDREFGVIGAPCRYHHSVRGINEMAAAASIG